MAAESLMSMSIDEPVLDSVTDDLDRSAQFSRLLSPWQKFVYLSYEFLGTFMLCYAFIMT